MDGVSTPHEVQAWAAKVENIGVLSRVASASGELVTEVGLLILI